MKNNCFFLILLSTIFLTFVHQQNVPCFNNELCTNDRQECIRLEEERNDTVYVIEYCSCFQGLTGVNCSECDDGYYNTSFSTCVPCHNCRNNGTCRNHECICSDRFTGIYCETCKEHFYGLDCLPIPVLLDFIPKTFEDIQMGHANITIVGDNLISKNNTILFDNVTCIFRYIYSSTILHTSKGLIMNNTHAVCPLPVLTYNYDQPNYYSYYLSLRINQNEMGVYDSYWGFYLKINRTCPSDSYSCNHGICELGQCKCYENFQGINCTECIQGHFYPLCLSCETKCFNNGTCVNQTCQCSDPDRFEGDDCSDCKPPYYKPLCEKRPVLLSIVPTHIYDVDMNKSSITFIGDHFNISGKMNFLLQNQMIQCQYKLYEDTVKTIAFEGNNTHIRCPIPIMQYISSTYVIRLFINDTAISTNELDEFISVSTEYTCPLNVTHCGPHGTCRFGKCQCFSGFNGSLCDRCADNYFAYPSCLPCSTCLNNGICQNHTCVCSDPDRFTGPECLQCKPHYYGSYCRQYPVLLRFEPWSWNDTESVNLLVYGEHYNIFNQLNISLENKYLICRFRAQQNYYRMYIIHAHQANESTIMCQTPIMLPDNYDLSVSFNNGTTWIGNYNYSNIRINKTCPSYTRTCSYHGDCAHGQCQCLNNYAGKICSRCADGYFHYPYCKSCSLYCSNNGTCVNQTCVCSDPDRFTGEDCSVCKPHFYGPSCLQYPILKSIEPNEWKDIDTINVTLIGDHFNISGMLTNPPRNGTVQCRFLSSGNYDYIVTALSVNNTNIVCRVTNMTFKYYGVYFSVDHGQTWYSDQWPISVVVSQTCPPYSNDCSSHGYCALGTCVCNKEYTGLTCNRCTENYFNYPRCVPCSNCQNGICTNGNCTCFDSNRFTGVDCRTCVPPYYGYKCLQYPIVKSIDRTNWYDVDEINVTIIGDNFNVSNLLNNLVKNQLIICRFESYSLSYIVYALAANNTHVVCGTARMRAARYSASISFTNGTSWIEQQSWIDIEIQAKCPDNSVACSYHGKCEWGQCKCNSEYSGLLCDRCAYDYFDYPNCRSCYYCNNGVCANSTCTCNEPDRFTGLDCSRCQPHYYGMLCLQEPVALSVKPERWHTTDNVRNITIIGDHFLVSDSVRLENVLCHFDHRIYDGVIVSAISIDNTRIVCPIEKMPYESYDVYFSLDNGTRWLSGYDRNIMKVQIEHICPIHPSICSNHGQCSFGQCLCNNQYKGVACNECKEGYFYYPNCYECTSFCRNNGTCRNQTCVCSDPERFTGYDCTSCMPHYYGYNCLQYTVAFDVQPSTWLDVGNVNITLMGDHFNISGKLQSLITNGSIQCRLWYSSSYYYDVNAIDGNNTHLVFLMPRIPNRYYSFYYRMNDSDQYKFVENVVIQVACPQAGCYYGTCAYTNCHCYNGFAGEACDRCIDSYYFFNSYCYSCAYECFNGGRCINQTCVCSDPDRFTGFNCHSCGLHYYGLNCLKLPTVLAIEPSQIFDTGSSDLTIVGDHFNISGQIEMLLANKSIRCRLSTYDGSKDYIIIARKANETHVVCRASSIPISYYDVRISLNNGDEWIGSLKINVVGTCPANSNVCNENGICVSGKCECVPPWTGLLCTVYTMKPIVRPSSVHAIVENGNLTIDLSTIIILATEPISYHVENMIDPESYEFFRRCIILDRSTGLMTITNALGSLKQFVYMIGISNTGGTVLHQLTISVPISYSISVQFLMENKYVAFYYQSVPFSGCITYLNESSYVTTPEVHVYINQNFYQKLNTDKNGCINGSFQLQNWHTVVTISAMHPAYSYRPSSISVQDRLYVAYLVFYRPPYINAFTGYVNNYTDLIVIYNPSSLPFFNVSLIVQTQNNLSSCIEHLTFYPDTTLLSLTPGTYYGYSLSIKTNCSINGDIHKIDVMASQFGLLTSIQIQLYSSWSCQTKDNCNYRGECVANETCQCRFPYAGDRCHECTIDHYNYPACIKCPRCIHGTPLCSTSEAICKCFDDDRFHGPLCEYCRTGYYGPQCEAIPIVSYLIPVSAIDRVYTEVTLIGDNFYNHSSVSCILHNGTNEIVLPGKYIDRRQITCQLPSHSARKVLLELQINETTVPPKLNFEYLPSCPDEGCIYGTCAFGSCLCRYPYFGSNCSLAPTVPKLRSIMNRTLIEKFPFVLDLKDYLIEGDEPLMWSVSPSISGMSIVANTTHSLLIWTSALASSRPHMITIGVKHVAMPSVSSQTFFIHVPLAYNVSVRFAPEVSQNILSKPARLRLIGQIYSLDSNYNLTQWDSEISVWVDVNGKTRRYLPSVIAPKWRIPSGSFETYYSMLSYEYGQIRFGASHPALRQIDDGNAQATITYFGLHLQILRTTTLEFRTGSFNHFPQIAKIINPTNQNVVNFSTALIGPNILTDYNVTLNCSLSNIQENILSANDECFIDLHLKFNVPYVGQIGYQFGNEIITPIYMILNVNVKADRAEFMISPSYRSITVARNTQEFISTTIFNVGSQPSNKLMVRVPTDQTYLTTITPTISSIPISGNSTVIYVIRITESAPLSIVDLRSEIIDEENQLSIMMSFRLIIVGSNMTNANISFIIEDEFTYFAEKKPNLANATVTLVSRNLNTRYVLTSNENGRAVATLIPDTYQLTVTAKNHSSYSSVITVDLSSDGQENVIFLQRQVVTHVWSVTPVTFQNEYQITLEATYEVALPIPTITVSPMTIDLDYLENSNVEQIEFLITNHGLIKANDIEMSLPNNHPFIRFHLEQAPIGDIEANSTILVTFRIERILMNSSQRQASDSCYVASTMYFYICIGPKLVRLPVPVFYRSTASGVPNSNCRPSSNIYDGASANRPTLSGGGGGGQYSQQNAGTSIQISVVPIDTATNDCRSSKSCGKSLLMCALGFIPGKVGCAITAISNTYSLIESTIYNETKPVKDIANDVFRNALACLPGKPQGVSRPPTSNSRVALPVVIAVAQTGLAVWDCISGIVEQCVFSKLQFRITNMTRTNPAVNEVLQDVNRMIQAYENYIQIHIMLVGNSQWYSINDSSWFVAFDRARADASELGAFLSDQEYRDLTAVLPHGANITLTSDLLLYYNRTMVAWKSNSTNQTLPHLDRDTFLRNIRQYMIDTNYALMKGYDNILACLNATLYKYKEAIEESEKLSGVCAAVKIQILQKLALTRQGFDARLELNNAGDTPITSIKMDIIIKSNENEEDLTRYFSIGRPAYSGTLTDVTGSGTLEGHSSGSVNWFIIPYSIAAPTIETWYRVGGNLSYVLDGELLHIPLVPDTILVQPDAQLHIAYFLDRFVTGPDPFLPATEQQAPEPFILSMIISNSGYGFARRFYISSGQPTIVENEKGLLIDFRMISMQVNNSQTSPTLSMNLGDLHPLTSTVVTWQMLSSLKGQFRSFNATYTETNPNGDSQLSLLVSLTSHSLIRQVSLDIYGRQFNDGRLDYLVDDFPDSDSIPDTVFSSTNATLSYTVYNILNHSSQYLTINSNTEKLILTIIPLSSVPSLSFIYVRLNNTFPNHKIVLSTRMNDNITMTVNTWLTSRTDHLEHNEQRTEHVLHLFDRLPNAYLRQTQYIYEIILMTRTDNMTTETSSTTPTTMIDISSSSPSNFISTDLESLSPSTATSNSGSHSSATTDLTTSQTISLNDTQTQNLLSSITVLYSSSMTDTNSITYASSETQLHSTTTAVSETIFNSNPTSTMNTTMNAQLTSNHELSTTVFTESTTMQTSSISSSQYTSTDLISTTIKLFFVDSYIEFQLTFSLPVSSWTLNSIEQKLLDDFIFAFDNVSSFQINISYLQIFNMKFENTNITVLVKLYNSAEFIRTASDLFDDFKQQLSANNSKLKQGTVAKYLQLSSMHNVEIRVYCSDTNTFEIKCKSTTGKDETTATNSRRLIIIIVVAVVVVVLGAGLGLYYIKHATQQSKSRKSKIQRKKIRKSSRYHDKRNQNMEFDELPSQSTSSDIYSIRL